jgi:hypothetical protein
VSRENNNNQHFDCNLCNQTKQRFNSTISNPMNKQQWTKKYFVLIHILFGQYNFFYMLILGPQAHCEVPEQKE